MTNNAKRQRQGKPERGYHKHDDHRDCDREVLPDYRSRVAADGNGERNIAQVIAHEHDIRSLHRDICAGRAHRNADRCRRERRRIIDSVADHRDWTDFFKRLEHTNFVFGQQIRVKFVYTRLLRYRRCHTTIVASEHDDAPDPDFFKRAHDRSGVLTQYIGDGKGPENAGGLFAYFPDEDARFAGVLQRPDLSAKRIWHRHTQRLKITQAANPDSPAGDQTACSLT